MCELLALIFRTTRAEQQEMRTRDSVGLNLCLFIVKMWLKVVAVCFVLTCSVSGLKPNHEPSIVVRTLIPPPEDCSVQAQKGDSVWIEHKGLYEGKLVDANPEGEPLKVPLGKNRILKGIHVYLL